MPIWRVLRGARRRRELNLGLGVVVALATAAVVAAPTFAAVATSALARERVAAADPDATEVSWAVTGSGHGRNVEATVAAARDLGGDSGRFDGPLVSAASVLAWPEVDADAPVVLGWREGMCDLVAVAGRCPSRPGEVLLPAGSPVARTYSVGDGLLLRGPSGTAVRLTVVGAWTARAVDGWTYPTRWHPGGSVPSFDDCGSVPSTVATTDRSGALLTDLSTLRGLPEVTVLADAPLAPTSDVEHVREAASLADHWEAGEASLPGGACATPVSDSDFEHMLGPIEKDHARLERSGLGAAVGAVFVGVLAVALVTTVSARRRRREIALLKLRGVRGTRLVWEAAAEPLVAVLAGALLGVPLGWAVAAFAAQVWLGGELATPLPTAAWRFAALIALLAAVGVVVGLVHVLREPIRHQLRPDRPRRAAVPILVARVAVLVAAAVGVYELRRAEPADPPWWAFTLPVVVGLAVGLLGAGLVRTAANALIRLSRTRRGDGLFLAARRLGRGRAMATVVPFAMAATVTVVVAGGAWSTGEQWREATALLRTGGSIALATDRDPAATLAATRRADPDGEWLMTAVSVTKSGGGYRRLFVDTSRWDRVVAPTLAATPTDVPAELDPDLVGGLGVPTSSHPDEAAGTRLEIAASVDAHWDRHVGGVRLSVVLTPAVGDDRYVELPLARHGEFDATVPVPYCRTGCGVGDLTVRSDEASGDWLVGRYTVQRMRLGHVDLLRRPWRATDPNLPGQWINRGPAGQISVRAIYQDVELTLPTADRRLPVVTAGLDLSDPFANPEPGAALGPDGTPLPATAVADVSSLPLVGDEGLLGDLETFLDREPAGSDVGEVLIVARSDTPAAVWDALRAEGIATEGSRSVEESQDVLDAAPYAQALRFFWLCGALVVVLAMATVATVLLSQRPARSREVAALRVVGVRRRGLRAAQILEVAIVAVLLAVCGWLGSWLSSWATLPALPIGEPTEYEPAPDPSIMWSAGVVPAVAAAGLLAVAALGVLLPAGRGSRPAALRSGGD